MKKHILDKSWCLQRLQTKSIFPVSIPSTVLTTLAENQVIPEPYWKDNESIALNMMEEDFEYQCDFEISDDLLSSDTILLHFDGIDTIADIYVNNQLAGHSSNMHRTWEYSVKNMLHNGANQIRVVLHSPLKYAADAYKNCPTKGSDGAWEGFSHVRKAHYMYGWDWGAHLPDAGIFREVSLISFHGARIDSVFIQQVHTADLVTLKFSPLFNKSEFWSEEFTIKNMEPGYSYRIQIIAPDGEVIASTTDTATIPSPQLWWPNGLGSQPLYNVTFLLLFHDQEIDRWERKIGLRTLTVNIAPDEWGECFAHEVNGKKIFAMGADYIPEEHLIARKESTRTRQLLSDCKFANYNCIRVWGGGYYPDDTFFELCDEMGFIVWEDFMFACSMYELTSEFEENITQEFIDNIKRIRHHACLGLWCGNNEMEDFAKQETWVTKASELRDYLFMYERIIPQVLKKYDPVTFYWPSSPSSGGSFDDPQDPNRGDVHFWQVWHGNKPFSEYRKYGFRYLSEFGFQALPSFQTIEEGITDDPQDMNIFSYVMEKHQRNSSANGRILNYLQQTFRYPYNFTSLIYASQLLQAEAIRYGVEHFRRNRGRCMGAVYWQVNDCWPVISWSSIDYYGRLKALHYFAKRFFSPVMISCEEENWMTADLDMNHQHFEFEKSIRLNVANDTLEKKNLLIRWALRNSDAKILRQEEIPVVVEPLSALWLDKVLLSDVDLFEQYVSYEVLDHDSVISSGTVIFSLPKYFHYKDPQLQYEVKGKQIIIHATSYAKNVEIQNKNEDLLLSDNYFDMNGGTATVDILRGAPEELRLSSVFDIGK